MSMKILATIKMFDFSNYLTKSKYYDNLHILVVGKTGGVAIEEFIGLKPKMCSYLVEDNSEN